MNTCYELTLGLRLLATYSHLVPAIAALILGFFAYFNTTYKYKAGLFLGFVLTFALWLIGDLLNWVANSYNLVAATWAPLDYLNVVFFVFLFAFAYVEILDRKLSKWLSWGLILSVAVPFAITMSGHAVYDFNQPQCEMGDNVFLANYKLILESILLVGVLSLGVFRVVKSWGDKSRILRSVLAVLSIGLFMAIFSGSEYLATSTSIYEINLYALLSLPVFVLALTLMVTNDKVFKLGDATIQILFYIFLVISGSGFFFVTGITDFILTAISFAVTIGFALLLFQGARREIKLRHQIEALAQELELTNQRQESLLHFVGHEVKGYLTKDMSAFAALAEGDFGVLPDTAKTLVQNALAQSRDGANSVIDILHASNQKKGTVEYKKEPFDLAALVTEWHGKVKPLAEKKGLALNLSIDESGKPYTVVGDGSQTGEHVLRNLFENSVNYTPTGHVDISLKKEQGKAVLSIKDTGVGISPEDRKRLFTEGGKGKDSIKVNVHSTGYGLFIAKNVVEAEGGTVRAESEGAGKGSTFIAEFPVS